MVTRLVNRKHLGFDSVRDLGPTEWAEFVQEFKVAAFFCLFFLNGPSFPEEFFIGPRFATNNDFP